MKALKDSDKDRHEQVCTEIRSDGAYVDQGEQDNLIVQKIESNADAIGVFGYSYLEENLDQLDGLTMNGVEPTYDNIASFKYPGARPLFIYVKNAHLDAIRGLREYVAEWAKSWAKDGPLAKVGLVASTPEVAARSAAAAKQFTPLVPTELK
jgi:phosphate transport system substrate-binding protein